jgi:hypothetical protein
VTSFEFLVSEIFNGNTPPKTYTCQNCEYRLITQTQILRQVTQNKRSVYCWALSIIRLTFLQKKNSKKLTLYIPVVVLCTTRFITLQNSTFCPHSVFMCFVWIWQQTSIISLHSINWLVFITEKECVYCAVQKDPLSTGLIEVYLHI